MNQASTSEWAFRLRLEEFMFHVRRLRVHGFGVQSFAVRV